VGEVGGGKIVFDFLHDFEIHRDLEDADGTFAGAHLEDLAQASDDIADGLLQSNTQHDLLNVRLDFLGYEEQVNFDWLEDR
jgi:hypothetical protein